ncbi:MAG: matrixin family metalloprotease, partial [Myxococcota bacterium]
MGVISSEASAYSRSTVAGSNACLYWGSRQVVWYMNENGATWIDDDSDIEAVMNGFEAWNQPECSDFEFVLGGLTDRIDTGYVEGANDNQNLVVFRDSLCSDILPSDDECWDCLDNGGPCCSSLYGCWEHPSGAIAMATTTFHRSTGLLVDADIELNEARYHFTARDGPPCEDGSVDSCTLDSDCKPHEECLRGECRTSGCVHTDVANTVAHEAGHALGLDHSEYVQATMYPSASLGDTNKRDLHEDDIQGLCDIYPAGGPTLTCLGDDVSIVPLEPVDATPSCWGCSSDGGSGAAGALLLFLPAVLLLLPRRRESLSCSAAPLVLLAAPLLGQEPGDLERWLARGEALVAAKVISEPEPCGAEGRPLVLSLRLEEVVSGSISVDRLEVLLPARAAEAFPEGKRVLAVIGRAGAEEGAGCVRAPAFILRQALDAADLRPQGLEAWASYVGAARSLPPGGAAMERALTDLWIDALDSERGDLRRHALLSLRAGCSRGHPVIVSRLSHLVLDRRMDLRIRGPILDLLSRVVAPNVRGRHLFEGGEEAAAEARAALISALEDPEPAIRARAIQSLTPLIKAG